MASVRGIKLGLTGLTLAAALFSGLVGARAPADAPDRVAPISVSEIPVPGAQTYELIARGGPFPSERRTVRCLAIESACSRPSRGVTTVNTP